METQFVHLKQTKFLIRIFKKYRNDSNLIAYTEKHSNYRFNQISSID